MKCCACLVLWSRASSLTSPLLLSGSEALRTRMHMTLLKTLVKRQGEYHAFEGDDHLDSLSHHDIFRNDCFTVPKTTCISIPLLSNRKSSLLLNCVASTFVWDFLKMITKIINIDHRPQFETREKISCRRCYPWRVWWVGKKCINLTTVNDLYLKLRQQKLIYFQFYPHS